MVKAIFIDFYGTVVHENRQEYLPVKMQGHTNHEQRYLKWH